MEILKAPSELIEQDIKKSGAGVYDGKAMPTCFMLFRAMYDGNFAVAQQIIDNDEIDNPESPIVLRFDYYDSRKIKKSNAYKIMNFLEKNGAVLEDYMILAIRDGNFELVDLLLRKRVDINATDKDGNTGLMLMMSKYKGVGMTRNNAQDLLHDVFVFTKGYAGFVDYGITNLNGESFADMVANSRFVPAVKQAIFFNMISLGNKKYVPIDFIYEIRKDHEK